MRITNPMIMNRMQLNFNRNAQQVDKLYNQMSTGKRVMFPSDDPILAGRALKFRTNVNETEQYQRNVGQGLSWMEITEGAFKNVTNITGRIRDLLVQGASDENSFNDRKKIVTDIEQLVKQLGTEMNVSYTGRYVFSGYRTDQPPVIQKDDPDALFNITQVFSGKNIEKIDVLQSGNANGIDTFSYTADMDIMKLAYSNGVHSGTMTLELGGGVIPFVSYPSLNDNGSGTTPPTSVDLSAFGTNEVYYIEDTGTFVLGSAIVEQMRVDGLALEVKYDKTGLEKGDLNPLVYFECIDKNTGKEYNMDHQDVEYEFGVSTRININSLAKNVYTDKMYADLVDFCNMFMSMPISTLDGIMASNPGMSEEQAKEILHTEEDQLRRMSQQRFNSLLGLLDAHSANVMREQTDLGSRMSRLELIEGRLEEDRINYKKLLSDSEDVDYTEAAMEMRLAETVYQAALQVGAKIMQMSLADYIR